MRVALSTDGESVSAHFGRCPHFTLVEIENDRVTDRKIVDNPGHVPGEIPKFLQGLGVQCVISGGMGPRARALFEERGITTFVGVSGPVSAAIEEFAAGRLTDGESPCRPGAGKGYGIDKVGCDHE
jgi:predicted Fe-Mo cluster-binding NifX family protein